MEDFQETKKNNFLQKVLTIGIKSNNIQNNSFEKNKSNIIEFHSSREHLNTDDKEKKSNNKNDFITKSKLQIYDATLKIANNNIQNYINDLIGIPINLEKYTNDNTFTKQNTLNVKNKTKGNKSVPNLLVLLSEEDKSFKNSNLNNKIQDNKYLKSFNNNLLSYDDNKNLNLKNNSKNNFKILKTFTVDYTSKIDNNLKEKKRNNLNDNESKRNLLNKIVYTKIETNNNLNNSNVMLLSENINFKNQKGEKFFNSINNSNSHNNIINDLNYLTKKNSINSIENKFLNKEENPQSLDIKNFFLGLNLDNNTLINKKNEIEKKEEIQQVNSSHNNLFNFENLSKNKNSQNILENNKNNPETSYNSKLNNNNNNNISFEFDNLDRDILHLHLKQSKQNFFIAENIQNNSSKTLKIISPEKKRILKAYVKNKINKNKILENQKRFIENLDSNFNSEKKIILNKNNNPESSNNYNNTENTKINQNNITDEYNKNLETSQDENRSIKKFNNIYDSFSGEDWDENKFIKPFYILHPGCFLKQFVDFLSIFFIFYTIIFSPYQLAFDNGDNQSTGFILYFDICIDFFFVSDFLINFFTAYQDKKDDLVFNLKLIFINYAKSWMIFDMISCIPFSFINYLNDQEEVIVSTITATNTRIGGSLVNFQRFAKLAKFYRLLKWTKIIRFLKIAKSDSNGKTFLNNIDGLKSSINRLIKFLVILGFITHIAACIWCFLATYSISNNESINWINHYNFTDSSDIDIYVAAIYFLLSTLFSVGYGDITPKSQNEMYVCLVYMIVGCFIYSYTLTSLSNIFSQIDKKTEIYNKKESILTDIRQEFNLDKVLEGKIKNSLKHDLNSWNEDRIKLLDTLPSILKNQLYLKMYENKIKNLIFFNGQSYEFLTFSLSLLKSVKFSRGDYIISIGEIISEMYLTIKGVIGVELGSKYKKQEICEIPRNYQFGDILMYTNQQSKLSYKVKSLYSELFILSKVNFAQLKLAFDKPTTKLLEYSFEFFMKIERTRILAVRYYEEKGSFLEFKKFLKNYIEEKNSNFFHDKKLEKIISDSDFSFRKKLEIEEENKIDNISNCDIFTIDSKKSNISNENLDIKEIGYRDKSEEKAEKLIRKSITNNYQVNRFKNNLFSNLQGNSKENQIINEKIRKNNAVNIIDKSNTTNFNSRKNNFENKTEYNSDNTNDLEFSKLYVENDLNNDKKGIFFNSMIFTLKEKNKLKEKYKSLELNIGSSDSLFMENKKIGKKITEKKNFVNLKKGKTFAFEENYISKKTIRNKTKKLEEKYKIVKSELMKSLTSGPKKNFHEDINNFYQFNYDKKNKENFNKKKINTENYSKINENKKKSFLIERKPTKTIKEITTNISNVNIDLHNNSKTLDLENLNKEEIVNHISENENILLKNNDKNSLLNPSKNIFYINNLNINYSNKNKSKNKSKIKNYQKKSIHSSSSDENINFKNIKSNFIKNTNADLNLENLNLNKNQHSEKYIQKNFKNSIQNNLKNKIQNTKENKENYFNEFTNNSDKKTNLDIQEKNNSNYKSKSFNKITIEKKPDFFNFKKNTENTYINSINNQKEIEINNNRPISITTKLNTKKTKKNFPRLTNEFNRPGIKFYNNKFSHFFDNGNSPSPSNNNNSNTKNELSFHLSKPAKSNYPDTANDSDNIQTEKNIKNLIPQNLRRKTMASSSKNSQNDINLNFGLNNNNSKNLNYFSKKKSSKENLIVEDNIRENNFFKLLSHKITYDGFLYKNKEVLQNCIKDFLDDIQWESRFKTMMNRLNNLELSMKDYVKNSNQIVNKRRRLSLKY